MFPPVSEEKNENSMFVVATIENGLDFVQSIRKTKPV